MSDQSAGRTMRASTEVTCCSASIQRRWAGLTTPSGGFQLPEEQRASLGVTEQAVHHAWRTPFGAVLVKVEIPQRVCEGPEPFLKEVLGLLRGRVTATGVATRR